MKPLFTAATILIPSAEQATEDQSEIGALVGSHVAPKFVEE